MTLVLCQQPPRPDVCCMSWGGVLYKSFYIGKVNSNLEPQTAHILITPKFNHIFIAAESTTDEMDNPTTHLPYYINYHEFRDAFLSSEFVEAFFPD